MNALSLPVHTEKASTQQPVSILETTTPSNACGHDNPPDAVFCGECGASLKAQPLSCSTCSQPNPAELKFCRGCGSRQFVMTEQANRVLLAAGVPPTCIAGRYHVQRLLGEGAKKRVYLAHDAFLNRDVALALFKAEGLDDDGRVRIQREIRALSQLGNHPYIVTLYDAGEEQSRPYFVSPYLPGGSIQELLRTAEHNRLALDHALRLADQICQALEYAHAHGIIHRDLKPSNVWLTQDGTVKLGDFGLATSLDHSRFSLVGVLIGTAAYLPPEQLQGRKLDARSDLYSLGAMLYEMVTGRPPFVGDGLVSLIGQHLNAQPVAPSVHNPLIPPALDTLILQLLAKDPDQRPEGAAAVRSLLHPIATASLSSSAFSPPSSIHALDRLAGEIFVGREREMDVLREQLEATFLGHGRAVILTGEPGIGKTRIAMEFATYARLRGARVLVSRCHEEEGMPPYWSWVQLLRTYIAERPLTALQTEMGAGASAIAQVLTEVQSQFPDLSPPPSMEPAQARFRFFDSFTQFLKNTARHQPLVLILDDLQWADTPSLLLLQFLTRELAGVPLFIVVTCRDMPPASQSPLTETLAALTRASGSQTLLLQGLSKSEVARFIEITTANIPAEELTTAVYNGTEGHPFFLTEVIRLLATEGNQVLLHNKAQTAFNLPLPQGVHSAIECRLAQVSEACRQLLTTAAVVGREFDRKVLEGLWSSPSPSLLDLLNEAMVARLIAPVASLAGRYNFSHALVRETLYESLSLSQSLQLHQQIGEVEEMLYGVHSDAQLAALAHRFFLVAQCGGAADKAIDYARRAGDRALAMLAYEEAALHYHHALQAMALHATDAVPHCDMLLALGEAQRRAGWVQQSRDAFLQVAAVARTSTEQLGVREAGSLLARAALGVATGFAGTGVTAGVVDPVIVSLLEDALLALAEDDCALKAKVLGRLAVELYWTDAVEKRATYSHQAVEMARRVGDPAALAYALNARRTVLCGPEYLENRLSDAVEVVQLAEHIKDRELALRGDIGRIADLIEQGNLPAADQALGLYRQQAEELRQPFYLWLLTVWRAMRAGLAGRFPEAEQLAQDALVIGQRASDSDAVQYFTAQIIAFRGGRGLKDSEAPTKKFIDQFAAIPSWRSALALIYADMGRWQDARQEFEYFAAQDFAPLPRNKEWLGALANLAQVCAFLRDSTRAATLYQLLVPYADRCIVFGQAVVCLGSVNRFLGLLAMTMGRWEVAQAHFEAALQKNIELGARPLVALTQFMYSWLFMIRRQPADLNRAATLLTEALATAQELGMEDLVKRIQETQSQVTQLQVPTAPLLALSEARGESQTHLGQGMEKVAQENAGDAVRQPDLKPRTLDALLRHEGDYWTLAYQDTVCRFKDVSGLRYIAHLLHHPQQEFHVTDLVYCEAGAEASAGTRDLEFVRQCGASVGLGDAGEVLDAQARAAYKQRVRDLQEELEEAREFNDRGRSEKLAEELEYLTQELAGAVGLGGRNRKAASATERARINVTRAIKAVIKKAGEQSESLGLYFATTIKTGTFCSYTPDPRIPVTWEF